MKVKALIIRFSSIGDIVLTSPIMRCLHKQLKGDVEIHYLTKKKYAALLQANPYIHKLHFLEDKLKDVYGPLKNEQFDYVIDLHNNLRSARVKHTLKKLSFTVDKINVRKWLITQFKINRLPDLHLVDRYFNCVKALGLSNDGLGLDCFIPPTDEADVSELPTPFSKGYIAFAIGGTYTTKKLPQNKIVDLCRRIERPVILLGGQKDKATGARIGSLCGQHVYNACGSFSLMQSASIISKADKVITHDTGMMHIASAFGKNIIVIWGNTIPAFGMYPYLRHGEGSAKSFEVKELRCRPCSKLGYDKCPKKHFYCMQLQDTDMIAAAVNANL